jgi:Prokaryotic RING finger family 2
MKWWEKGKKKEPAGSDLYRELRKEIPEARKQGELPARDGGSFSKYFCDLCNSTFTIHELRQCSICGRWGCSACWTPEYYICNSCNGILKIHLLRSKDEP